MICLESQALVGFNCVQADVLQLVSLQLGHQTNAAPFLLLVNQNASALLADHRQSHLELLAAVAAQRSEDVASKTLRVNTHQRRRRLDVAHHQRHGAFYFLVAAERALKAQNAEFAPTGREVSGSDLSNRLKAHVYHYIGSDRSLGESGLRC